MTEYMTMADVVRRLKSVPRHKITYALDSQRIPEPARISGRRMFTEDDVAKILLYFDGRKGGES
jgi:hypothetical protein